MRILKVAVFCEKSGKVRDAFNKLGHDAWSFDLQETDSPGNHIKGDCTPYLSQDWDLIIAHPPCTYISNSGVRWLYLPNKELNLERWDNLEKAIEFFNLFVSHPCKYKAIENPIPHKWGTNGFWNYVPGVGEHFVKGIGKYSQTIQPYEFGHTTSKRTCLWLEGLPDLKPTHIVPKELRTQDIWLCPPGPERQNIRSATFQGIADAMAQQWSEYILNQSPC